MNEDEIIEDLADLRLRLSLQNGLLAVALAHLAETSPAIRSCLEDVLWQAEVGQLHFGPNAKIVNAALPDAHDIIRSTLDDVSRNLSTPLIARRQVPR